MLVPWRVLNAGLLVLLLATLPGTRSLRKLEENANPASIGSGSRDGTPKPTNPAEQPPRAGPPFDAGQPCAPGCEKRGNCNRALGVCECPIGYAGPTCEEPLFLSCRVHPAALEMYCAAAYPRSCACVRECKQFVCRKGACERAYDTTQMRCFERPAKFSVVVDGVEWDGGSDVPEEDETGVKYYKGEGVEWERRRGANESDVRREFLQLNWDGRPAYEMAVPIRKCLEKCNLRGACIQGLVGTKPRCQCHYGWVGPTCAHADVGNPYQQVCYNKCHGRGACRRGFCHCEPGWWGKDCGRSAVYAPHSAQRLTHKLRVYAYDLPWQVAYQPEFYLGWRYYDQIYTAWMAFAGAFYNDTIVRTENPWEANLFYIPAMSYAYSSNLGDEFALEHTRQAIEYVRGAWPFFNRTQGMDHFVWLTNDRGACNWPAESDPHLANIIKVVHFGWHHHGTNMPQGWGPLPNPHWGCFHPIRDISAAPTWLNQAGSAAKTYGLLGMNATFDPDHIPTKHLLFFAGGVRKDIPDYSNGARQALHKHYGAGQHPRMTVTEGHVEHYDDEVRQAKFCAAMSGHGWGIRLGQFMTQGCVPVIIQDDTYQAWEDLLPYHEFSVRFPQSRMHQLADALSAIDDEDYRALRRGVAKHWRAFVWDKAVGGTAYDYMVESLRARLMRLNARHYHSLHPDHRNAIAMQEA